MGQGYGRESFMGVLSSSALPIKAAVEGAPSSGFHVSATLLNGDWSGFVLRIKEPLKRVPLSKLSNYYIRTTFSGAVVGNKRPLVQVEGFLEGFPAVGLFVDWSCNSFHYTGFIISTAAVNNTNLDSVSTSRLVAMNSSDRSHTYEDKSLTYKDMKELCTQGRAMLSEFWNKQIQKANQILQPPPQNPLPTSTATIAPTKTPGISNQSVSAIAPIPQVTQIPSQASPPPVILLPPPPPLLPKPPTAQVSVPNNVITLDDDGDDTEPEEASPQAKFKKLLALRKALIAGPSTTVLI